MAVYVEKLGIFHANKTFICLGPHQKKRVRMVPSNMFKPFSNFLTDRSKAVLPLWIFFDICGSCHTLLSVPFSLVVTFWERADLLAHWYVMFSCVLSLFHLVSWVRCGI